MFDVIDNFVTNITSMLNGP